MYSKHLDTLINFENIYSSPVYFFQDYYRVKSESFTDTLDRMTVGNKTNFNSTVKVENEYVEYPVIEFQKPVPIVGEQTNGFITVLIKADELFATTELSLMWIQMIGLRLQLQKHSAWE